MPLYLALLLSLVLHAALIAAPAWRAGGQPPAVAASLQARLTPPPAMAAEAVSTDAAEIGREIRPRLAAVPRRLEGGSLRRAQAALTEHLFYPPEAVARGLEGDVVLLLTLGLPWTLDGLGRLDWGVTLGAYAATLLMAGAYVAVGMFFSSLTRDQIVAALLSIVLLGILLFLGFPEFLALLSRFGLPEWLIELCGALSPSRYFLSITRGVLDSRDLIYFGAFCGLFLYFNALVLRGRRLRG